MTSYQRKQRKLFETFSAYGDREAVDTNLTKTFTPHELYVDSHAPKAPTIEAQEERRRNIDTMTSEERQEFYEKLDLFSKHVDRTQSVDVAARDRITLLGAPRSYTTPTYEACIEARAANYDLPEDLRNALLDTPAVRQLSVAINSAVQKARARGRGATADIMYSAVREHGGDPRLVFKPEHDRDVSTLGVLTPPQETWFIVSWIVGKMFVCVECFGPRACRWSYVQGSLANPKEFQSNSLSSQPGTKHLPPPIEPSSELISRVVELNHHRGYARGPDPNTFTMGGGDAREQLNHLFSARQGTLQ